MNRSLGLHIFVRSLRDRWPRLAVAVLAAALGETLLVGLIATSSGVRSGMDEILARYAAGAVVLPKGDGRDSLAGWDESEASGIVDIVTQSGALACVERYAVATLEEKGRLEGSQRVVVVGTDLREAVTLHPWWQTAGDANPSFMTGFRSSKPLSPGTAARPWRLLSGSATLDLAGPCMSFASGTGDEDQVWISTDDFSKLFEGRDRVCLVRVRTGGKEAWETALHFAAPSARVVHPQEAAAAQRGLLDRLEGLLWSISGIVLATALLALLSLFTLNVLDRQQEIGIFRALGATRAAIIGLFVGEAVLVGAAGGLLGLVFGLAGAQALSQKLFERAATAPPWLLPVALGAGLFTSLAATAWPLRRALALDAAAVLRGE